MQDIQIQMLQACSPSETDQSRLSCSREATCVHTVQKFQVLVNTMCLRKAAVSLQKLLPLVVFGTSTTDLAGLSGRSIPTSAATGSDVNLKLSGAAGCAGKISIGSFAKAEVQAEKLTNVHVACCLYTPAQDRSCMQMQITALAVQASNH